MASSETRVIRTQWDLANVLGISQVTVHKALSNQAGVSPALRERINRMAAEGGYRLHSGAKAMRGGHFGAIALVQSENPAWSVLPGLLLSGVEAAAAKADKHLVIARLSDDTLTSEGSVPKILRECMSDGLLVNYNAAVPPKMAELLSKYRIPCVWINSKHDHDCVFPNDLEASYRLTQWLLSLGHRRIVYLNYSCPVGIEPHHYSFIERVAGFQTAMNECGLHAQTHGSAQEWDSGVTRESITALLRHESPPTAIIGYGLREARAAISTAGLLGISIPESLSVACFTEHVYDDFGRPLAGMHLPELEMGAAAVGMLLKKLEAPEDLHPPLALRCEILEGATVKKLI